MPELRNYQKEDLKFLLKLNSAGIFSEQRTGKTPLAISYAKEKKIQKTLILCPASAIPVWTTMWPIWYPGQECVGVYGSSHAIKTKQIQQWKHALAISYDTLKTTKTHKGFIAELQHENYKTNGNPELVIIDEAHRIQTRNAAATSAVYVFIKAPYKLALTGTPAQNKPYQIFSILRWLYPKTFTSYWAYVDEFYNWTTQKNWKTGDTWRQIGDFINDEKRKEHAEILNKISVQRKRKDVMPWLPEKEYQRIALEAAPMQRRAIDHLKTYFEVGEIECQSLLDGLIRERQLCLDPTLLDIKSASPKTEWILQYLKDYPNRRIIIFSKFTTYLKKLAEAIKQHAPERNFKLFTGSTPITTRAAIVKEFQDKELDLLLLQVDTAKEAITLDTAEVAIFTDKYPPVGSIAQAEDRFVATTEDKRNKQHSIIELCIKDTYDERLYDIIADNKEMTDVINDYAKYLKGE